MGVLMTSTGSAEYRGGQFIRVKAEVDTSVLKEAGERVRANAQAAANIEAKDRGFKPKPLEWTNWTVAKSPVMPKAALSGVK